MKIREAQIIEEPETTIDTKLELIKSLSQVNGTISRDLTADYTLAKFNEKEQTLTMESLNNAYYAVNTILRLAERLKTWKWQGSYWELLPITKKEKELLIYYAKSLFSTMMIRPNTISVLKRNQTDNELLKIMAGIQNEPDENEPEPDEKEQKKITDAFTKLIKRNKENKE